MKILVDTPIWSFALRRSARQLSPTERAAARALRDLITRDHVLLPGVVRQELLSGIRDSAVFERLRDHLRDFDDVPVRVEDYEEAARCRNRCAAAGAASSAVDMLLCALSLRLEAPVFTSDPDFTRYARVLDLRVVGVEQVNAALRRAKERE